MVRYGRLDALPPVAREAEDLVLGDISALEQSVCTAARERAGAVRLELPGAARRD